jgi:hypothetical protein
MSMPGIVELSPLASVTTEEDGITGLLAHLAAAGEVVGQAPPPMVEIRRSDRHPGAHVEIAVETGHGCTVLIGFAVDDPNGPVATGWTARDPSVEAIALARDALLAIDPSVPRAEPDEADLIVHGLAWSLLDEDPDAAATIHRATPWSAAGIVLGRRETEDGAFRFSGHVPTPIQALALQAMRPGTRVRPGMRSVRLHPIGTRLETLGADAMVRMRETALWLDFERSRT